jgi:hypothetical protein
VTARARWRRPTLPGLLTALVKLSLLVVGIFALWMQVGLARNTIRLPPFPTWDGAAIWYQAERIRSGEALYAPLPSYGPHVMADHMAGSVRFPLGASPHLPLPAALVALSPVRSLDGFVSVWAVVLLLATWGFASVLAILAHRRWTLPRFLWWNGLTFLFPGAYTAARLGNPEPVLWLLFAAAVALPARLGSAGLVLAAAVKPFAAWPLAFSLVRGRETWKAALVSAVVVLAVCVVAMGPADFLRSARDWLAYVPGAMGQGTFRHGNVSLSFGVLRIAYGLGWWDYQPGPIVEAWPRIWLTSAQLAAPLAAGFLTYRWDRRLHLSIVMLAALLFSPICWMTYLAVALVPVAAWVGGRRTDPAPGSPTVGDATHDPAKSHGS